MPGVSVWTASGIFPSALRSFQHSPTRNAGRRNEIVQAANWKQASLVKLAAVVGPLRDLLKELLANIKCT